MASGDVDSVRCRRPCRRQGCSSGGDPGSGGLIPHSRARVGMAGGDLHIPEVDASIEHGRDESVAEHVRVRPGHLDAGGLGEMAQAAGGRVPVHPGAVDVEQDRPAPGATVPCWASYAKNWRNTSTTPRGSPGSSGRQKPRPSSSTTEHLPPRPIGGITARFCGNVMQCALLRTASAHRAAREDAAGRDESRWDRTSQSAFRLSRRM
jgi:hypothetical protein